VVASGVWLEHARARGEPAPRTIAHANLPRRVARYQLRGVAIRIISARKANLREVNDYENGAFQT